MFESRLSGTDCERTGECYTRRMVDCGHSLFSKVGELSKMMGRQVISWQALLIARWSVAKIKPFTGRLIIEKSSFGAFCFNFRGFDFKGFQLQRLRWLTDYLAADKNVFLTGSQLDKTMANAHSPYTGSRRYRLSITEFIKRYESSYSRRHTLMKTFDRKVITALANVKFRLKKLRWKHFSEDTSMKKFESLLF